ncbi:MAG TPA: hypothetical protein DC053_13380 [Lachnoclostridium sp.]|nr:hypothetical protein [Lachnoclostridium sp.]
MSIVLSFATTEFAVMKADGRELSSDNKIINEHINKISIIGEHCAAGYAGKVNIITLVINKALEICKECGISQSELTVSTFAEICQKVLINNTEFLSEVDDPCMNLVVIGLENNKIIMKSLGTGNNFEIIDRSPAEKNQFTCFSLTSDFAENAIQFNEFFNEKLSVSENMDNYIKYIASIDPSVNTNITTISIKRK